MDLQQKAKSCLATNAFSQSTRCRQPCESHWQAGWMIVLVDFEIRESSFLLTRLCSIVDVVKNYFRGSNLETSWRLRVDNEGTTSGVQGEIRDKTRGEQGEHEAEAILLGVLFVTS